MTVVRLANAVIAELSVARLTPELGTVATLFMEAEHVRCCGVHLVLSWDGLEFEKNG